MYCLLATLPRLSRWDISVYTMICHLYLPTLALAVICKMPRVCEYNLSMFQLRATPCTATAFGCNDLGHDFHYSIKGMASRDCFIEQSGTNLARHPLNLVPGKLLLASVLKCGWNKSGQCSSDPANPHGVPCISISSPHTRPDALTSSMSRCSGTKINLSKQHDSRVTLPCVVLFHPDELLGYNTSDM